MKYKAIIDIDEYEDFEFYEDGNGKYIHGIDAGSVDGEWIPLHFTECENETDECEDCVSRQVVSDFLNGHAKDFEDVKVRMAFKAASSLVKNSDNVPSVTSARRKGQSNG